MRDFVFHNTTKVYFGKDQLKHLPEELEKYGKRVLLVYGGGSVKRSGLYDRIQKLLKDFELFDLPGVEPNPRHTTVNRGAKLCRENGVDVVLAIGGGSSIDCAKAVAATTLAETDDVWDLVEGRVPYPKALPVCVVLTIAATGSEMDRGAVISNMEKNVKRSIHGEMLRPRVTFEDPELTYTVPAYQTACGSVDIMSHVFDVAYFTAQEEYDMLKRIQEEILITVLKFAPVAIREPDNYEARANLMWASSWALNDFLYGGVAQQVACHAMDHELSAFYDITHGHGLAILTPRWLRYILDADTAPMIRRFGVRCMGVDPLLSDKEGAEAAVAALEHFFFETLGLKSRLSDLGIDDSKFPQMAANACKGGVIASVKPLNQQDVENIFRMCL